MTKLTYFTLEQRQLIYNSLYLAAETSFQDAKKSENIDVAETLLAVATMRQMLAKAIENCKELAIEQ